MTRLPILALAGLLGLAGCGTGSTPQTPAQAAFAIRATYNGAMTVATAYDKLPPCVGPLVICSQQAVKTQIKVAVDTADPLIAAEEAIALSIKPDATALANAIAAANAALNNLTAITTVLRIK